LKIKLCIFINTDRTWLLRWRECERYPIASGQKECVKWMNAWNRR